MSKRKKTKEPASFSKVPTQDFARNKSGLFTPISPHQKRLNQYKFPPIPKKGSIEAELMSRQLKANPVIRAKVRQMKKHAYNLISERLNGGSQLQTSEQLRWFMGEYANRIWSLGQDSLPCSFNIVEAFLKYDPEYVFFDLRKEIEHIVSLDDYFDWYTSGKIPEDPKIIADILPEGAVFTYEMLINPGGFRFTSDSEQVVAGVSFVRHEYELSCLLLAGEYPSLRDTDPPPEFSEMRLRPGKEDLRPASDLTDDDRFLAGYPNFSKLIILARFDLRNGKHDVRYVNIDEGRSFRVLTDDPVILDEVDETRRDSIVNMLHRYDDLFSCASALIYLPAFFAAESDRVSEIELQTKFSAVPLDPDYKKLIRELGGQNCTMRRRVQILNLPLDGAGGSTLHISPPKLKFQSDGYWKPIDPQAIGEDKIGNKILGRTWVSRHQTWAAASPKEFSVTRKEKAIDGTDPGFIYIQRSESHEIDIYKIGLTRRSVEERSTELSRPTGVPLPFGIIAKWEVGDCSLVERKAHEALAQYRINPNREFFRADLTIICGIITEIVLDRRS